MAHRLFSPVTRLPPLVHHEDGFNEDEARGLNPKRNIFRRLALARAHALVVPSTILRGIARSVWHQPEGRVRLIPNGIDVAPYAHLPSDDAIPGFVRSPGKLVVGTLAGLRRVKNLPRLVQAVAPLSDQVQLVIVGDGPEREAIAREAAALGMEDICMPGFLGEPWRFMGLFDIFALSSDSEQFPISLVEAMAAGLPAISSDVGDVKAMVSLENAPFIVRPEADALTVALQTLCADAALRARIGPANHVRVRESFSEDQMVRAYAALYGQAVGNSSIFHADLLS